MKRIYYKSDFDFLLHITDAQGNRIGWPDFDWHARIWTASPNVYFEAGCHGGQCLNCFNDNGRIHIVANGHRLLPGVLSVEFSAELPDEIYPDGSRLEVTAASVDIILTRVAPMQNSAGLKADMSLPVYRSGTSGAQSGPVVLQRGMIPLGAKPGLPYRNLGYIKLPPQDVNGDIDIDVSGVDLDYVGGVYMTVPVDYSYELDCSSKILHLHLYGCPGYTYAYVGVRLLLKMVKSGAEHGVVGYGGDYIMRCADGLIRPVCDVNGFSPIDPVPRAPVIHSGIYNCIRSKHAPKAPSIRGLISSLMGRTEIMGWSSAFEVQLKVCRKPRKKPFLPPKTKWLKIRRDGTARDQRRFGVARVRHVSRCNKSPWTVFSFMVMSNGFYSIAVLS